MENTYPAIGNVTRIEYGGQPIIPTARLAEFYDCQPRNIQQNFNNNTDRFIGLCQRFCVNSKPPKNANF